MNIRKANNDDLNEKVRLLSDDKLGSKREDFKIPLPTEYLNTFSYKKPNFWVREKKAILSKSRFGISIQRYVNPYRNKVW